MKDDFFSEYLQKYMENLPLDEQELFSRYMTLGDDGFEEFEEEDMNRGRQAYVKSITDMIDWFVNSENPDNFEIVPEQMAKYGRALKFFSNYIKEFSGKIEPVELEPRLYRLGLNVYVSTLCLSGEELAEFNKIISDSSAISIDATDFGVCISLNIPDVFRKKKKDEQ